MIFFKISNKNFNNYCSSSKKKDMNKYFLMLLLFILGSTHLKSQETEVINNYYTNMNSCIISLDTASSSKSFLYASEQFAVLADAEKTKWIPYYHASYAYIMSVLLSPKEKNIAELIAKAQDMLNAAKKLRPNNEEITALQGFIYQAQMINKEGKEIHTWAQKAITEYDHARFMNPENPRPYFLIGQMLYTLPPGFGGNKESACQHFIQAQEKFDSFLPKSSFSPNWGKGGNSRMLKKCK